MSFLFKSTISEIGDGGFACACFGSKVGLTRTTSAALVDGSSCAYVWISPVALQAVCYSSSEQSSWAGSLFSQVNELELNTSRNSRNTKAFCFTTGRCKCRGEYYDCRKRWDQSARADYKEQLILFSQVIVILRRFYTEIP